MLDLYISPSCASCRKVKKYFDTHKIKYKEKNIFTNPLTREDIMKMLMRSENGFEDIISTRSKVIKENNIDINKMKMNEFVDFIIANPSILKRPIIVADEEIQVGYNEDEITLFLPEELRELDCLHCMNEDDCLFNNAIRNIK